MQFSGGFLSLLALAGGLWLSGCNSEKAAQVNTPKTPQPAAEMRPNIQSPPEEDSRPDILLLTIDTLRQENLSFYGYTVENAPFLSSLAAGATIFDRAYSTSSWTVPAVASMLTGVYPSTHGAIHGVVLKGKVVQQEVLPASLPTIAEKLHAAGYRTYAVVANGHIDASHGFARGFDTFDCIGFVPADTAGAALDRLSEGIANTEGPVFLWVHYFDPHQPCFAHEPWLSRFRADLTEAERNRLAAMRDRKSIWEMILKEGRRGRELGMAMYDSEIAYCDQYIGDLFKKMPFLDQFLIMVTADHGDEYLEHGDLGHGFNLYEETVKIPFFVRPPGGGEARRSDRLMSILDVPPTLAALAGITVDDQWQGRAVIGVDGDPLLEGRREVLAELDRFKGYSQSAIITERWKLIWNRSRGSVELYDLLSDPMEGKDTSASATKKSASLFEDLRWRLSELRQTGVTTTGAVDPDRLEALRMLGYVGEQNENIDH